MPKNLLRKFSETQEMLFLLNSLCKVDCIFGPRKKKEYKKPLYVFSMMISKKKEEEEQSDTNLRTQTQIKK